MKKYEVSSLGIGNKSAYDEIGVRLFVPERFRTTIKENDWVVAIDRTFETRTNPETGAVEPCEKWTRSEVTMIGTLDRVVGALNKEELYAEVEAAILVDAKKAIRAKFKLSAPTVEEAIGA